MQFRIDIFVENGHSKSFLEDLIRKYQNKKKESYKDNSFGKIKKLPCIPNIGPKLKHEFKQFGQSIAFT